MQVETRDIIGKRHTIETADIRYNMVRVGTDWYHLSKLFDSEGKSLMYLAWRDDE